jgi:hypothetical protein
MANITTRTARKATLQIFDRALSTSEKGKTETSVWMNKLIKVISPAIRGTNCFAPNRYQAISGAAAHKS